MRQRNDTQQALYIQRADPPFWVGPGEDVDWHSQIIGLTPVDEPLADEQSDNPPDADAGSEPTDAPEGDDPA